MIEVLFDESAAATMKMVKKEGIINGDREKVICLALMLDIGDIRKSIDSQYRRNLIYEMYTQDNYDNSPETLKELKKIGSIYANEQKRFMEYVSKGEQIRIWYSNAPYSICGFYYVCNLLKDASNEIFAVKLPDYTKENEKTVIEYKRWGEVPLEKFDIFLKYEKKISKIEKKVFSNYWLELKNDNSPLRAVVNGQLIGVPEDFYDYLIYKSLSKRAMKEIRLIGDILGQYRLGISDWWYASRIDKMIKDNKIKIVEDSDRKYTRIISIVR